MPTDVEIRRFDPAHRDPLIALSLRAWAPVFAGMRAALPGYLYDAFYPGSWQTRQRADIVAFLDDAGAESWVALRGERLLGWAGTRRHPEDRMGEIVFLATDPPAQRQGVGRALIDHCLGRFAAAGLDVALIETGGDPGHAAARAAYAAAGFDAWPVTRYVRKLT